MFSISTSLCVHMYVFMYVHVCAYLYTCLHPKRASHTSHDTTKYLCTCLSTHLHLHSIPWINITLQHSMILEKLSGKLTNQSDLLYMCDQVNCPLRGRHIHIMDLLMNRALDGYELSE